MKYNRKELLAVPKRKWNEILTDVKCTVDRKTVKKRKSFPVSGSYSNGYYYNGTFVEKSVSRNVFFSKEDAVCKCEELNNK